MDMESRWEVAIKRANEIYNQYENLSDGNTYNSIKEGIKDYLYLTDVWRRKSISVLEWLEKLTFEPEKWRDRKMIGMKRGKAGHDFI